jgi:hypothetical protein
LVLEQFPYKEQVVGSNPTPSIMIIKLHFKTPNAVDYAIKSLEEEDQELVKKQLEKYIQYGECITLSLDTETGVLSVVHQ